MELKMKMSITDRLTMILVWICVITFLGILYVLMLINMLWRKIFPLKPPLETYDKDRVI